MNPDLKDATRRAKQRHVGTQHNHPSLRHTVKISVCLCSVTSCPLREPVQRRYMALQLYPMSYYCIYHPLKPAHHNARHNVSNEKTRKEDGHDRSTKKKVETKERKRSRYTTCPTESGSSCPAVSELPTANDIVMLILRQFLYETRFTLYPLTTKYDRDHFSYSPHANPSDGTAVGEIQPLERATQLASSNQRVNEGIHEGLHFQPPVSNIYGLP